jgi:glycosyltransferase involved in cell wall biosynthesis
MSIRENLGEVVHQAYSAGRPSILVIGPVPPPVHGFSQATMEIASLFETAGYSVACIDLKPVRGKKGILSSLKVRLRQMAEVVVKARRGADFYLALSGGPRQVVDLVFLLLGRLCGTKMYIHHHSFSYLSRTSRLASLCFRVCGPSATHLVLCGAMEAELSRRYGVVRNTEIFSNSALLGGGGPFRQRTEVKTLGFLGALTLDKGIFEFLQVAAQLAPVNPDLRFRIAGPCNDEGILIRVKNACQSCSNLEYVGPVYGEAKTEYLETLDVLLFPSTYRNEAEPFVIWEAQASGIPVIAPDRGCMGEILRPEAKHAVVVPLDQCFVEMTVKTIRNWLSDSKAYAQRSTEVNHRFRNAAIAAQRRFEQVFCPQRRVLDVKPDGRFRRTKLIQIETCPVDPPIPRPPGWREC